MSLRKLSRCGSEHLARKMCLLLYNKLAVHSASLSAPCPSLGKNASLKVPSWVELSNRKQTHLDTWTQVSLQDHGGPLHIVVGIILSEPSCQAAPKEPDAEVPSILEAPDRTAQPGLDRIWTNSTWALHLTFTNLRHFQSTPHSSRTAADATRRMEIRCRNAI